jgi:hypothetical protein
MKTPLETLNDKIRKAERAYNRGLVTDAELMALYAQAEAMRNAANEHSK